MLTNEFNQSAQLKRRNMIIATIKCLIAALIAYTCYQTRRLYSKDALSLRLTRAATIKLSRRSRTLERTARSETHHTSTNKDYLFEYISSLLQPNCKLTKSETAFNYTRTKYKKLTVGSAQSSSVNSIDEDIISSIPSNINHDTRRTVLREAS